MAGLYLLAPALAFGVLGAHFFRSAGYFVPNYLAIAVCVAMIVLLLVRRPWAARAVQAALVLGAIEWVRWTFVLVNTRQEVGAPYLRLALILGGVALLTALCALLVQTPRLKAYFRL